MTKEKLNLILTIISNIRNKTLPNYKGHSLEDLIKKIDLKNLNYTIYSTEIKYLYEVKKIRQKKEFKK